MDNLSVRAKKYAHRRDIGAGISGGALLRVKCQAGNLGLGKMGVPIGVARATGGVPVPVCSVNSNYTRQGYRYGYETDV